MYMILIILLFCSVTYFIEFLITFIIIIIFFSLGSNNETCNFFPMRIESNIFFVKATPCNNINQFNVFQLQYSYLKVRLRSEIFCE